MDSHSYSTVESLTVDFIFLIFPALYSSYVCFLCVCVFAFEIIIRVPFTLSKTIKHWFIS